MYQTRSSILWRGVLFALLTLWLCAGSVRAADIVGMPVASLPPAGHMSVNCIYWNLERPVSVAPEHVKILEVYYSLTDRLEIDTLTFRPSGYSNATEFNVAYRLSKQTKRQAGVVIGATNLFKEDKPPLDGEISPYLAACYDVVTPKAGPPSLKSPVIRLHAGIGSEFHSSPRHNTDLFGGVQVAVSPYGGFAILNYQHQPAYMITVQAKPPKGPEFTVGSKEGTFFARVGYTWNLK